MPHRQSPDRLTPSAVRSHDGVELSGESNMGVCVEELVVITDRLVRPSVQSNVQSGIHFEARSCVAGLQAHLKMKSAAKSDDRRADRRRRLTALVLAVALAAPTVRYSVAQEAPAAAAAPADAKSALSTATELYKAGNYEEALTALQAIKSDTLSADDQKILGDSIAKTEQAAQARRAARADFEKGQTALEAGDNVGAMTLFKGVASNEYADDGTKTKAREQIAVSEAGVKNQQGDLKGMYDSAVVAYKAGDLPTARAKFSTLQEAGFKAPWFSESPRDYLAEIDKKMAGPSDSEQAKAAYLTGRDDYKKGDWIAARENFNKAVALGYKAGWFEDAPSKYLERMDKKEQADASKAAMLASANSASDAAPAAAAPATAPASDLAAAPVAVAAAVPADTHSNPAGGVSTTVAPGDKVVAMTDAAPATPAPTPAATPATSPSPANHNTVVTVQPNATPAMTPAANTDEAALANLAAARKTKVQADAIQAQQLVKSGKSAEESQRYQEALTDYSNALALDPSNAEALAGRGRTASLTGNAPVSDDLGSRGQREIEARRQAVKFAFNMSIMQAQMETSQGKFDAAQSSLAKADAAAKSDPTIFQNAEIQAFDVQLANARTAREQAIAADTAQKAENARVAAQQDAATRAQVDQQAKERAIASLIADSRRLTDQGKYDQALKVVDQIITIDGQNEYAKGVRPILSDRASLQYQKEMKDEFGRQWVQSFDSLEEKKIPYSDVLKYPPNWPDLSAKRDQTVRDERNVTAADEALNGILDKNLPEIRFQDVAFADVIDFLRDTTQANIFVNWKALEAAGIDRNAPVSTRLRNVKFSKVLKTILDSLGGGATVKLGYTVDEGVITISTEEDLARNVETRTYDIRDLLLAIPDFTDAPTMDLTSATSSSNSARGAGQGSNGGGGNSGGGNQNIFGGGGGGQGGQDDKNTPSREELVEQITSLIRETIGVGSWKEDGGQLGSLRELGGQLIVTQTPEIHRQISSLLEKLREQRSIQVMIETRFLTVQRNFLEDVGVDFDFYLNYDGNQFGSTLPGSGFNAATGTGSISNVTNPNTGSVISGTAPIAIQQNSSNFTIPGSLQTGVNGNLGSEFGTPNLSTTINAFLDDFQASILVRATQGNQNVTQLTAPRLTLFNGQQAYVAVVRQIAYVSDLTPVVGQGAVGFDPTINTINSGVVLKVKAVVSADRKYVTLTLQPQLTNLIAIRTFQVSAAAVNNGTTNTNTGTGTGTTVADTTVLSSFIQEPEQQVTEVATSVSVPDGGTLLLGGTTVSGEIEREAGVPVLSKIPFLKRAFTNRGYAQDESVLLILVKPTIIIQREIEQDNFPLLTSRPG